MAAKKEKKGRGEAVEAALAPKVVSNTVAIPPRFQAKYKQEVVPALVKQFSYKNPNQVPRLMKIVVNMGLGKAVETPKIIDTAVVELQAFTDRRNGYAPQRAHVGVP
jgi:large subunit ribosomal protein L5